MGQPWRQKDSDENHNPELTRDDVVGLESSDIGTLMEMPKKMNSNAMVKIIQRNPSAQRSANRYLRPLRFSNTAVIR
jgi:hypothetical protein